MADFLPPWQAVNRLGRRRATLPWCLQTGNQLRIAKSPMLWCDDTMQGSIPSGSALVYDGSVHVHWLCMFSVFLLFVGLYFYTEYGVVKKL